ncbi:heparinase II/III-family protein [bacterium]|nr:heparinase II/III-family protein [bacterium]
MCRHCRFVPWAVPLMLLCGGATVQAANLATGPGGVAVAESQHRDRWGVDGSQPWLACDGKNETSWLSDNWEYSHTLALIFPRQVTVRQVVIHWGGGKPPLTITVRRWQDGKWGDLKTVTPPADAPSVAIDLDPVAVTALAVTQPAGQAHPEADRRLRLGEVQVMGEPVEPAATVDVAALRMAIVANLAAARQAEADQRVAPQLAVVMAKPKTAGFMGVINREDLERGQRNLATRPWARKFADRVLKDADWWVGQSDEAIYKLIPEGNPRALCPQFEKGCPIHGGARGVFRATIEKPYVWKCSKGGEEWYDGALVKHPQTGADVTVRDDGNGWLAPEGFLHPGRRYYFVAAYRYFLIGKLFSGPYEGDGGSLYQGGTPVTQLSLAYALTGEAKYAHKCAVMLGRLAEVYRFYDGCVEGPSQRQDGYIGQTFERFLVQNLIQACDLIWDAVGQDEELARFFAAQQTAGDYNGDGKITPADVQFNLQRNLLGYIYEYLHRCMPYFDGDFIMYEMTALAALAATLGNEEITREVLESDVGLRVLLTNSWFRDGKFIYDSTGYNLGNAQTPLQIAEWLHGVPYRGKPLDLYDDPDYRMSALFDFIRHVDCDGRVPQIGDVGGSRSRSLRETPAYSTYDERALLRLPSRRDIYLCRLLAASGGNLEGLRESTADAWLVFHAGSPLTPPGSGPTKPESPSSHIFDDGGIAILRAGSTAATRLHVPMTFSKGQYAHGHPDKLAINLFRYGYDLSADLGYPTTWTDIKNGGWETNTASHCTVMVDERGQQGYVIGNLHFFAAEPLCDVVEASAERAYPQCSLYRRTVGVVRDEQGEPLYVVDFFRVAGGKTRDYHFHSLGKPEDLTIASAGVSPAQGAGAGETPALNWVKQERGTLAGEEVAPMSKGGYGWLWDVQRTSSERPLVAQWAPTTGTSQGDRYLLTRQSFRNCTVEFKITRTGQAGGPQERCVFVFATDPRHVNDRRVIMMPAGSFPVGQPVPVKIVVQGGKAAMTVGGKPSGSVDVTGAAPEQGSVGLLHYYNYAWDYSDFTITPEGGQPIVADFTRPLSDDFWARNDGTYAAVGGVLQARDSEPVRLVMHTVGALGRELIRAVSEGYGVRGQAPLEGHVILRDRPSDAQAISTFATVFEPTNRQPVVRSVAELPVVAGAGERPGETTALLVETEGGNGQPRRDVIISSVSPDEAHERRVKLGDQEIILKGRFAALRAVGGRFATGMLVGGGGLTAEGCNLKLPGAYRGTITAANVAQAAIAVKTSPGSPSPGAKLVGRKLLVRNPSYGYTSVYTVEKVEALSGGAVRLTLNMPLLVARGVIQSVAAAQGSFASQTPVMKLRVNKGLFDGKPVRPSPEGREWRLKSATEQAFVLQDAKGLTEFVPGGSYVVCDLGIGDEVEVILSGSARGTD